MHAPRVWFSLLELLHCMVLSLLILIPVLLLRLARALLFPTRSYFDDDAYATSLRRHTYFVGSERLTRSRGAVHSRARA